MLVVAENLFPHARPSDQLCAEPHKCDPLVVEGDRLTSGWGKVEPHTKFDGLNPPAHCVAPLTSVHRTLPQAVAVDDG